MERQNMNERREKKRFKNKGKYDYVNYGATTILFSSVKLIDSDSGYDDIPLGDIA